MTFQARSWVDPAVDLVLCQVVPPMGHKTLGSVLELVTRFDLFFVGMTVGAEGLLVAEVADLFLLNGEKLVTLVIISRMIQGSTPIIMAVTAHGGGRNFNGVNPADARRRGAGVQSRKEGKENHE